MQGGRLVLGVQLVLGCAMQGSCSCVTCGGNYCAKLTSRVDGSQQ